MPTTCATCHAEVGDAAACPRCGTVVLSPQAQGDWRTDTSERRQARSPVEPAPAGTTPSPARYPLYADELDVAAHSGSSPEHPAIASDPTPTYATPPPLHSHEPDDVDADDDRGGGAAWVAWVLVAIVLLLVAVGGVWLLFSPGKDDPATDPPAQTRSTPEGSEDTGDPGSSPEQSASDPAAEPDFSGDAVDVASTAQATAPSTAPPNADAFGNRTTYDAANMLDGLPDTCWRMAGDGTGIELTFRLAEPTLMARVGLVNGYAKNAVVGGRNLNWYLGNRRVLSAQWVFDDGTTVDQPLGATKQMQTIDLGDRVATSTVTLRLVAVSSPGTGRSARDYTAVSEVALVGVPAA